MSTTKYMEKVIESVEFLKKWHGTAPELAIVLGSGLSDAIPGINTMKSIQYNKIPGFKHSTVKGHKGDLSIGMISAKTADDIQKEREIAFLRGRNHAYEGNNPGEVVHNIRSLILWGVKGIILTNAAGCLNTEWELGRMMVITDHINATGLSPLNGEYGHGFGAQFVDMSASYDKKWQMQFKAVAAATDQPIYDGIYYGVLGAHYETPAEIRMFKTVGASAVGMSTVLETIAARQLGAKVAGLSCLTNYGAGLKQEQLSHHEVMEMGSRFSNEMANIVLRAAVALEV